MSSRSLLRTWTAVFPTLLFAACSTDPENAREAAREAAATAFYRHNHARDFTLFRGVSVRISQPVLKQNTTVLGYTYAISFCEEVEDVMGQRGTRDHIFYYSDWPSRQYELRRAGITPAQRRFLQRHFHVRAWEAEGAFVTFAEELIEQFRLLQPPGAFRAPPHYLRALSACTAAEGAVVHFAVAPGAEVIYLPDDALASAHWQRQRKTLRALNRNWFWH